MESLMAQKGIQLGNTIELGTSEGVKRAVAANLGIALLSRHLLGHELANGTIKAVLLAGGEPSRDLYPGSLSVAGGPSLCGAAVHLIVIGPKILIIPKGA